MLGSTTQSEFFSRNQIFHVEFGNQNFQNVFKNSYICPYCNLLVPGVTKNDQTSIIKLFLVIQGSNFTC